MPLAMLALHLAVLALKEHESKVLVMAEPPAVRWVMTSQASVGVD